MAVWLDGLMAACVDCCNLESLTPRVVGAYMCICIYIYVHIYTYIYIRIYKVCE